MNDDPTPTLMSIGRCFVGALHGPSDKANDKVFVVTWNSGIRMAPSSKYCSVQRYAPATDRPRNTSVAHRQWVRCGSPRAIPASSQARQNTLNYRTQSLQHC